MKKLTLFLLVNSVSFLGFSQTVSTISAGLFSDGLGVDSKGNVYGSDWPGNSVFKYDTAGNVTTFKSGFLNPNGIAINDSDHIYICDYGANRIYKYDISGNVLDTILGFTTPTGIQKIPGTNDFLVVEYSTSKLKRLDANGTITQLHLGTPLNGPSGIAFIDTSVYISNYNNRGIYRYNSNGSFTLIAFIPSFAGTNNAVGFMSSLYGKLYATQIQGNRIYEIDPSNNNVVTVYAGSSLGNVDGPISSATFNGPNGILGDPLRNKMYITDFRSKNLRIISNITVGLEKVFEKKSLDIEIFPNPTTSQLTIKLEKGTHQEVEVQIINAHGKILLSKTIAVDNNQIIIPLNEQLFPSGSYVAAIRNNGLFTSQLFIIE